MVQIVTNSNGGGGGNKNAVIGPSSAVDGDIVIFDGDTGKIIKDSGEKLSNLQVKWIEVNVATAYGTAAKVGTTEGGDYTPTKGDFLLVNFVNGCSVNNPTLNIDGSGAKAIRTGNANATTSTFALGNTANSNIKALLYYDGTYYRCWSTTNSNTTYSAMSVSEGEAGTATSQRSMRADYLKQIIKYHAVSDTEYGSSWDGKTNIAPSQNAVYDKIETVVGSIPTDNAQLANGCSYVTSGDLPDFSKYQLTCNLVTSLSGADDTHYPSAKAVSDAITSAGGGDMLKSVYDPNNCAKDAFNYNNMYNQPTIPTVCNVLNSSCTTEALSAKQGCVLNSCVSAINGKIPSAATTTNQLADKNYVDNSINSVAAYYITKNAAGDQFATYAELANATTYYSGGVTRTPTRNDYTVVLDDENHDNATTRYSYQGNGWEYQYTINETALTQAQLDALNSGITAAKVSCYDCIPVVTDNCQIANGCGYTTCTGTISTCAQIISTLGYTPYNNTNPNGYTTCTGTLVSGDNITCLTNNAGYTTCTGTLVAGDLTVVSGDTGCVYTIKKSTVAPSGAGSNTITLVVE